MTTTALPPTHAPPRGPTTAPRLRLAIKPPGSHEGPLDGAWWPRSDDFLNELPSLVDSLDRHWGRITRVAVDPRPWRRLPEEVPCVGHTVEVGAPSQEQDRHTLALASFAVGSWELLVIPPHTDPEAAARLMAAATDPAGGPVAGALISAEAVRHEAGMPAEACAPTAAEDTWVSEGGAAGTGTGATDPSGVRRPLGRLHSSAGR